MSYMRREVVGRRVYFQVTASMQPITTWLAALSLCSQILQPNSGQFAISSFGTSLVIITQASNCLTILETIETIQGESVVICQENGEVNATGTESAPHASFPHYAIGIIVAGIVAIGESPVAMSKNLRKAMIERALVAAECFVVGSAEHC